MVWYCKWTLSAYYFLNIFPPSLLYGKNTVYNTYNIQHVLTVYVISKVNSRLFVVKFLGSQKLYVDFLHKD